MSPGGPEPAAIAEGAPGPLGRRGSVVVALGLAGLASFLMLGLSPADLVPHAGGLAIARDFLGAALRPALDYEAAAAPAALAQDAAEEGYALEEVVVTARKMSENIQDIPVAITAIGADTIQTDGEDAISAWGGDTDHWAYGSWTYGAGGGAGGSIYLIADTVDLAADSVDAQGGLGQSSYIRAGGDGGYGRVRIDCSDCNGYSSGSTDAESALQDASEPDPGYSTTPE